MEEQSENGTTSNEELTNTGSDKNITHYEDALIVESTSTRDLWNDFCKSRSEKDSIVNKNQINMYKIGKMIHNTTHGFFGYCSYDTHDTFMLSIPSLEKIKKRGYIPISDTVYRRIGQSKYVCIIEIDWSSTTKNVKFRHVRTFMSSLVIGESTPERIQNQGRAKGNALFKNFYIFGLISPKDVAHDESFYKINISELFMPCDIEYNWDSFHYKTGNAPPPQKRQRQQNGNVTLSSRSIESPSSAQSLDNNNNKLGENYINGARITSDMRKFEKLDTCVKYSVRNGLMAFGHDINDRAAKHYISCTGYEIYKVIVFGDTRGNDYIHSNSIHEVIIDGRPIIPYFDVEFEIDGNERWMDMKDMITERAILFIEHAFYYLLNITISKQSWIVLDSSSDKKCSRHMMIRQHDIIFTSANTFTLFMKYVKALFDSYTENGNQYCSYLTFKKRMKTKNAATSSKKEIKYASIPFFDFGIYSTNRCFRTFKSTKLGEQRPFEIHTELSTHDLCKNITNPPGKELFLNTLITYVIPDGEHELITCKLLSTRVVNKINYMNGTMRAHVASGDSTPQRKMNADRDLIPLTDLRYVSLKSFILDNFKYLDWDEITLYKYTFKDQSPTMTQSRRGSSYYLAKCNASVICTMIPSEGNDPAKGIFKVLTIHQTKSGVGTGQSFILIWENGFVNTKCHSTNCQNACICVTAELSTNLIQLLWPKKPVNT